MEQESIAILNTAFFSQTKISRGFAHILLVLLLVVGLGITVYLASYTGFFKFFSKATTEPVSFIGPTVTFKDNQYYTTSLQGVKLQLVSPITPPVSSPSPAVLAATSGSDTKVSCNTDVSLSVSPSSVNAGGNVTFSISGDASTYIVDDYGGGAVNCNGDWTVGGPGKTCTASSSPGTYTWTHSWKHCENSLDNCSDTCSKQTSFVVVGSQGKTPYYTASFKWAKSPTDLETAALIPYDAEPKIIDYAFSSTAVGTSETVFVEFLGSGGEKVRKQATITYNPVVPAGDIDGLTTQLVQARDDYNQANKGIQPLGQVASIDTLVELASKREEQMKRQIKENPADFLKQKRLYDQKDTFPKEAQAFLEDKVDKKGKLLVIYEDDIKNNKHKLAYRLKSDDKNYTLHFAQNPPKLRSGSEVSVKGVAVDSEVAVMSGENSGGEFSLQTLSAAPLGGVQSGQHKIAIVKINFTGNAIQPYTDQDIQNLMMTGSSSFNNFYLETSFNQLSFTTDIYGWYTENTDRTNCDSAYDWSDEADNRLISNGVNLSSYDHLIYVFANEYCFFGLGGAGGNPGRVWLSYSRLPDKHSFIHEVGHNLGLDHAGTIRCGTLAIDDYSRCSFDEYGDIYNVMGNFWYVGTAIYQFNAEQKYVTGWIPSSRVQEVTTSGRYTIAPSEVVSTGIQVLKIHRTNTNDNYYVSYRQPLGFDSTLPTGTTRGANIHISDRTEDFVGMTKLIDTTPQTRNSGDNSQGFSDAALSDGAAFADPANNLTIKQVSHSASQVTVEVNLNSTGSPAPTPMPTPTPTPTPAPFTQTFSLNGGWTLIGLTLSKPSYKARDFLTDLNTGGNIVSKIVRWNTVSNSYEVYEGGSAPNFNIASGMGYFINNTSGSNTSRGINGTAANLDSLTLVPGWNLISFTRVPSALNKADTLVAELTRQGLTTSSIARWYNGAWQTHIANFPVNKFDITPGQGYFINLSVGGTFILPSSWHLLSAQVSLPCTPCTADIDKDSKVTNNDIRRWGSCNNKKITDKDSKGNLCKLADTNGDTSINTSDFSCIKSNLNKTCSLVKPAKPAGPLPVLPKP